MTSSVPDLLSLLCLDPRKSSSPFGGQHRTILIVKDYFNAGDFAFNNLLQHFGKREPNTHIVLITLSHDWTHYSASSAKCGFNLRRTQNQGNIDVINVMEKYLEILEDEASDSFNLCSYILEGVKTFLTKYANQDSKSDVTKAADNPTFSNQDTRPTVVMIDDLSVLLSIGVSPLNLYQLASSLDQLLRTSSTNLKSDCVSHLIIQTMFTNNKPKQQAQSQIPSDNNLNHLIANIENISDLCLTLKPLNTGHSTRVDGTILIADHRLSRTDSTAKTSQLLPTRQTPLPASNIFPDTSADIGTTKCYFFKLGDKRVRLTSRALIC